MLSSEDNLVIIKVRIFFIICYMLSNVTTLLGTLALNFIKTSSGYCCTVCKWINWGSQMVGFSQVHDLSCTKFMLFLILTNNVFFQEAYDSHRELSTE